MALLFLSRAKSSQIIVGFDLFEFTGFSHW